MTKPNPSPNHKRRPSVKKEEVGLPEHDVTGVTSLHTLEEGFDSAKPHCPSPQALLSKGRGDGDDITLCSRIG